MGISSPYLLPAALLIRRYHQQETGLMGLQNSPSGLSTVLQCHRDVIHQENKETGEQLHPYLLQQLFGASVPLAFHTKAVNTSRQGLSYGSLQITLRYSSCSPFQALWCYDKTKVITAASDTRECLIEWFFVSSRFVFPLMMPFAFSKLSGLSVLVLFSAVSLPSVAVWCCTAMLAFTLLKRQCATNTACNSLIKIDGSVYSLKEITSHFSSSKQGWFCFDGFYDLFSLFSANICPAIYFKIYSWKRAGVKYRKEKVWHSLKAFI